MGPEREIRLDSAAFLDSPQARGLACARTDQRTIVERFLAVAYGELGKAPHLMEGEDLEELLLTRLPAHFGKADPLAAAVEPVLDAWLHFLGEERVVAHAYELRRALLERAPGFRRVVAAGERAGQAPRQKRRPFVHRAEKTGRNDPCPCGSGRKFKQCCMQLGG